MNTQRVEKHILSNGLTVLLYPVHTVPKVSVQLWYNVGSKDEIEGQRGIAHFIEHMIFKGTSRLSECDINLITSKLSGYSNAFTSHDYTGYLFDFPSQHWFEALPIMADCMTNCLFKEEFMNSELKAVIQEIKLYKDDYTSTLVESMLGSIVPDHPYHYPIIGYKQELWQLERKKLVEFYQEHYVPNNATLVIVGDIESDHALNLVKKSFESIKPNWNYRKREFFHCRDLKTESVTIYRDVQQPVLLFSWVTPGTKEKKDYLLDLLAWILGSGQSSRLHRKLVDGLQLANEVEAFGYDLFDLGLLFIYVQPKRINDLELIRSHIQAEIDDIVAHGVKDEELTRAVKKTQTSYLSLFENYQKLAYAIGKYYLAVKDEQFVFSFLQSHTASLAPELKDIVQQYLRSSLMHEGKILPLAAKDKSYWNALQEASDKEDEKMLSQKTRQIPIEEGKCVVDIVVKPPKTFYFAKGESFVLPNGLKVIAHHNAYLPKIDIMIDLKAKYYYDPIELQGLCDFVYDMLNEGTQKYPGNSFSQVLESYGMNLNISAGLITLSLLSQDLPIALELIDQILTQAEFKKSECEKLRAKKKAELQMYWDDPQDFIDQLIRQEIYQHHPLSKSPFGTTQTLASITQKDLVSFYKKYVVPHGTRLALVGDLGGYDLRSLMTSHLGNWSGPEVQDLAYPLLNQPVKKEINYTIARDQTVLAFAGISTTRLNKDFDRMLIFDQIFSGGSLGSMGSRLFDLRERSGLFYTISGSLTYRSSKQPGLVLVKTVVSNDRLKEAETAIEHLIDTAIESFTQDEYAQAKDTLVNALVNNFSSNRQTASSLIFCDTFNLPQDYFDNRAKELDKISREEVKMTVKKYLDTTKMVKFRVGRV